MVFESLISRRLIAKSFSKNQGDSRLYSDLWRLYSDFRRLYAEPQGSRRLAKSRLKNLAHHQIPPPLEEADLRWTAGAGASQPVPLSFPWLSSISLLSPDPLHPASCRLSPASLRSSPPQWRSLPWPTGAAGFPRHSNDVRRCRARPCRLQGCLSLLPHASGPCLGASVRTTASRPWLLCCGAGALLEKFKLKSLVRADCRGMDAPLTSMEAWPRSCTSAPTV